MPIIAAVAEQLAADNLPILFLDTCILLDIIRAIMRRSKNCVRFAAQLHGIATSAPPQCRVVVSYIVQHEWGKNHEKVLDEAKKHLAEIHDQANHFHDACGVFGINPGFARVNYEGLGVAEQMDILSRQVLDCSVVIDADNECSGKAMNRVMLNLPPSTKGGEAKDCTIVEQYLAVSGILHAGGFPRKCVFCTSNTNDYYDQAGLHANLAADFVGAGLRFTANLPWGFHDLMH
jgi:hypothetical protein